MFKTGVSVIAKSGFGKYGYAFLTQVGGVKGPDVHIVPKVMSTPGFDPDLLESGTTLVVDIDQDKKGRLSVARVHTVNGQATQPKVSSIYLDQFHNPSWPTKNPEKPGMVLWQILDKADSLVQYVVANGDGLVLQQLGRISSKEARAAIGLQPSSKPKFRSRQEKLIAEFPVMPAGRMNTGVAEQFATH